MIQATGITKSFGSVQVLRGIDFNAADSEVISIVGASGAGKSTLLQILGSLSRPDTGKVLIDGTDIFALSSDALADFRNRKIGFVFQFHHLLPEFSAEENVAMPALISGARLKDVLPEARDMLERVGLSREHANRFPHEFSGGQRQRAGIARALAVNPEFVVCDEASSALDVSVQAQIINLLMDLRDAVEKIK